MKPFSYDYYSMMLSEALASNYIISSFPEYDPNNEKTVILRHDVDYTLNGVLQLASIESKLGITASYLFRVHAHEYNLFSPYVAVLINKLRKMGHDIGLHYEAPAFSSALKDNLFNVMQREITVIETILDKPIDTVAEHRDFSYNMTNPPKLFDNYTIDDFNVKFNAMDSKYCKEMKYLSDSNANWREGDLAQNLNKFNRFQILVHPDWWSENNLLLKGPYQHGLGNLEIK